ncbi:MAG: YeeE/YedE family protein, partial [Candidatus Rokubacteria bacterium]|nr:YeeE/YedE family protein [Candidatus Rokubacteria bacterium]
AAPVLADVTTVMDLGIILGALLAAGLAGRFAPARRVPLRIVAASVLGGLMLGYGARLAFGCNIGAYFSGVASTSLHGWLWGAAALLGTPIGLRLRKVFGVDRQPTNAPSC